MKVKVNGAWVDVPAFKVVEQVKDFEVLEGDITLPSEANTIFITHDLGVLPERVEVYTTDDHAIVTNLCYACAMYKMLSAIYYVNVSEYCSTTSGLSRAYGPYQCNPNNPTPTPAITTSIVKLYSGVSTRMFYAGNYHFKIYYKL